jgi:hypothetical protein
MRNIFYIFFANLVRLTFFVRFVPRQSLHFCHIRSIPISRDDDDVKINQDLHEK